MWLGDRCRVAAAHFREDGHPRYSRCWLPPVLCDLGLARVSSSWLTLVTHRCVSTSKASRWPFGQCPETHIDRDTSFMNFVIKEKQTLGICETRTTDENILSEDQLFPSTDYLPPLWGACWWDLDIWSRRLSFASCDCVAQP